jgi:nitroreductase
MKEDFFELVRKRRSIRVFEPKRVESNLINKILETANLAPSAGNLQAYQIVVVRDELILKKLQLAALNQPWVAQTGVCLVFLADPKRSEIRYGLRGRRLYCLQDATIATTYAQLGAHALGLATVWIGAFDDEAVSKAIGAAKHLVPVALLPIGYPAESPSPTPRRPLKELVSEL